MRGSFFRTHLNRRALIANVSLSASGDLYLCAFIPQNSDTASLFQQMAGNDKGALHISQWPNPNLTL